MGERAAVDRASRFLGVEVIEAFGSIGVVVVRAFKFTAFIDN